jgi:hypothetical protein
VEINLAAFAINALAKIVPPAIIATISKFQYDGIIRGKLEENCDDGWNILI